MASKIKQPIPATVTAAVGKRESETNTLAPEAEIRQRAYEIWMQGDRQNGSDVADWLQAEEEVLRESETSRT